MVLSAARYNLMLPRAEGGEPSADPVSRLANQAHAPSSSVGAAPAAPRRGWPLSGGSRGQPQPAALPFDQAAHNTRVYLTYDFTGVYTREPIQLPELMILLKYSDDFVRKRVLDLGVGTGRATRFLLPFASDYVGIDISPTMLDSCRHSFPGARLVHLDIRQVSALAPERFDFVLGAYCILDAVSHDERVKLLSDLYHLMSPHALLVFSSHNRRYRSAGQGPTLLRSRNPVTQVHHLVEFFRHLANHRRLKQHEQSAEGWAVLNDAGCSWQMLHYYIDREQQRLQLRAAGFDLLDVYDEAGRALSPDQDDLGSAMLHYVARRHQG
jgi:SAM-dependent methyltransferase